MLKPICGMHYKPLLANVIFKHALYGSRNCILFPLFGHAVACAKRDVYAIMGWAFSSSHKDIYCFVQMYSLITIQRHGLFNWLLDYVFCR
jgi:hypothetical protein